jgi:hypothetical protein
MPRPTFEQEREAILQRVHDVPACLDRCQEEAIVAAVEPLLLRVRALEEDVELLRRGKEPPARGRGD